MIPFLESLCARRKQVLRQFDLAWARMEDVKRSVPKTSNIQSQVLIIDSGTYDLATSAGYESFLMRAMRPIYGEMLAVNGR